MPVWASIPTELEEERLGRLGITTEHSTAMLSWQRWSRYRGTYTATQKRV